MTRHLVSTKWVRLVATVALATPVALALSTGSGNAALQLGIDTELTRFEIDGDAVPGVSSNGTPLNANVNGDWGLVEADYGYGPQPIGSDALQPAPAGIGSTGTLPLVFDQSRADDFPVVDPAPNPQYPTVPGSTEFCPSGEDDNWEGGTKVQSLINIDNPLLGPGDTLNLGCGQTLDKGNLFRAYEAYEVVAIPNIYGDPLSGSQNHTVLYGAWERGDVPGELNFYIPVSDSIPGNSTGDRLIAFDYDSSSPATFRILLWSGSAWVVAATGTAGDGTFQAAVGFTDATAFPDNGRPSFGEFALDLTASGVLPNTVDGACVDLTTAGYIFTETGNSASAQLKDYVGAPRLPIGNCGAFDVTKAGPANATFAPEFGYRSEQEDLEAIFPTATTPAGQTEIRIDDMIQIGETDRWADVYAQPDYLVFEPDPLVTDPPTPGWSQTMVECTYVDAFSPGFPVVTDRMLYDGTTHVIGEYLQVQSYAFLTLAGHGTLDPATGEYAGFVPSCLITNEAAGIVIEKAGAGDLTQLFGFEANGHTADLTIGQSVFLAFDEGTPVTILEAPLVGADPAWDLTSIECFNDGAIDPFVSGDPALGEVTTTSQGPANTIRCVFTNVQRGSITIEKTATPDLPQLFTFETATLPGGNFQLGDGDSATFTDLTPGAYSVDETEVTGWSLTGLDCTSGLGTSQVTTDVATGITDIALAAGDAVSCRYTNTAIDGELTIEKLITGAIDDTLAWSFGFELSDPDGVVGTGNITGTGTVPDDTLAFTNLVPGTTYTLVEWEMPPGWTANSMTCTVTPPLVGAPSVITTDGTFTVLPGSTVVCAFDNSPDPGELTIEKLITGAIDDTLAWSFGFELSDPDGLVGTGNITGTGTVPDDTLAFTNLVPGTTYTVTETAQAGWTANPMTCTVTPGVPEGLPVVTTDGTFTVLPGSTVLCTFDNTPDPGSITIAKTTEGGDGDFTFAIAAAGGPPMEVVVTTTDGSGSALLTGLVPGTTYTVIELDPGERWIPGDLFCSVVHAGGGAEVYDAAGFTVVPGDAISCGMTNTEQGVIVIDKVTLPADDTTAFDFTVSGAASDTFTVTGPGAPYTTGLVPPGTYKVTELAEVGWVFQGVECNGAATIVDAAATIELAPGEVVTCTFTNARRGPLTITKTVTEGPTRTGVDVYDLTYQVEVTSQSHVDEVYDLVDEVLFGNGITVVSTTATGPVGVTLEANWNGTTITLLVDDATIAPLGTHEFTITATGMVDLMSTDESRDCVLSVGETGTGFLNDATVTWLDGSASDDACEDTPDPDVADLAIIKTASVTTTGPNGTFDWILDITNNGPAQAVSVVVGDLVPTTLTVTGVTSSEFACSHVGNAVTCTKAAMAVGETGQVTIAIVVPGTAVSGSVTNIGTVESDTPDPDLTNNSDDAKVDIVKQLAPTTTAALVLPETGSGSTDPMVTAAAWLTMLGGAALLIALRRRSDVLETG